MVGTSVNPLNNQVSDVFSNGSTQYYRGAVYEYAGGQYLVAKYVQAGKGYWVYSPKGTDKANPLYLYGNRDSISLNLSKGWNIVCPVYYIDNFDAQFKAYSKIVSSANIYLFESNTDGTMKYGAQTNKLDADKAYWIYANEDVELPLKSVEQ